MNRRDFIKTAAVAAGCAAGLPIAAKAAPVIESAVATVTTVAPLDSIFRTGSFITIVNTNGSKRYNGIYRVGFIAADRCTFTISHKK